MLNNYIKYDNGVIKQDKIVKLREYDQEYVVNSYVNYGEAPNYMSYLRLGYLYGVIGKKPKSILDIGYGNGAFLKVVHDDGVDAWGSDISGYPVPNGASFIDWNDVFHNEFDVICFFDVLEHFEDISFVKNLQCKYIYISLPLCHYFSDEWFENWKHRRPDEHIFHFNENSLTNFMGEMGFDFVSTSNVEDNIRKPIVDNTNILTGIYKKR